MRKTFRKRPAEDDPSDGDGDSADLGRIAKCGKLAMPNSMMLLITRTDLGAEA